MHKKIVYLEQCHNPISERYPAFVHKMYKCHDVGMYRLKVNQLTVTEFILSLIQVRQLSATDNSYAMVTEKHLKPF